MVLSLPLQAISIVRRFSWLRGICSISISSQSKPKPAIISTKYGSEQASQVPTAGLPLCKICLNLFAMFSLAPNQETVNSVFCQVFDAKSTIKNGVLNCLISYPIVDRAGSFRGCERRFAKTFYWGDLRF